ncbi:hypothetical protein GT045_20965 [Streptomyces sp. SID486]|nr:hypothetical protein [Streptomyces sp. SID486]
MGPWAFSEATVLRVLAAVAAATAVAGAVVMRRWDTQAGRQVAELTRARAGDEWRHEERVAELETDLEESRELRAKLEQRLRAKRAELAGLRNEHAALLRRYATAETERASALEGRRLLEIEAVPSEPGPTSARRPALPPARGAGSATAGATTGPSETSGPAEGSGPTEDSGTAEGSGTGEGSGTAEGSGTGEGSGTAEACGASEDGPAVPAVFSAAGGPLYRKALKALAGFDREAPLEAGAETETEAGSRAEAEAEFGSGAGSESSAGSGSESSAGSGAERSAGSAGGSESFGGAEPVPGSGGAPESVGRSEAAGAAGGQPTGEGATAHGAAGPEVPEGAVSEAGAATTGEGAVGGVRDGAGVPPAAELAPAVGRPPAGHFTVPTAVAVVPSGPARRPAVQGGFDFFGTQKGASNAALDSVQNEDLADVVGPEALAVHKAESEAGFKQADERSRGVGQVIDLTAHDETEQIDIQGLRSAVS